MKAIFHFAMIVCASIAVPAGRAAAGEEPQGLLLRKGLVTWQAPLKQARTFVEENIHPNTLHLLRDQKQAGFGCEHEATPGVSHCTWACCVDLGETGIVHCATLWFYNDHFYAYDVSFDTTYFPRLYSAMADKLGPPSKKTQESRVTPNFLSGGIGSYSVNTRRWDAGNTAVLLADRGAQGKPLAGHLYVTYLPLAREATPARTDNNAAGGKLPF